MPKFENLNSERYVQTGEQSALTPKIMEIADTLPSEKQELVKEISRGIKSLKTINTKEVDFSRKPDEIIESGCSLGCHEDGLLFVTLLRAKGFDVSYIQAFLKEDLVNYKDQETSSNRGHVFLRTQLPEGNSIIDASTGEVTQEIPSDYVLGSEGLDSWDIGLKTRDDYINLFLETKAKQ